MQNLYCPSFFLTSTTGEAQGLQLSSTSPSTSGPGTCHSIFACFSGDARQALCLMRGWSPVLMRCLTSVHLPVLWSDRLKTPLNLCSSRESSSLGCDVMGEPSSRQGAQHMTAGQHWPQKKGQVVFQFFFLFCPHPSLLSALSLFPSPFQIIFICRTNQEAS